MFILRAETTNEKMNIPQFREFIIDKLRNELPNDLYYHCPEHTMDVFDSATRIAKEEGILDADIKIIQLAALLHDIGFTRNYAEHEIVSQIIAKEILPDWGISPTMIEVICELIEATRIPQSPRSHLAEILCDADLDYLGRNDFGTIGDTLFKEFLEHGIVKNRQEWDQIQIRFLSNHHYFTRFGKTMREPEKQLRLKELRKKYSSET